MIEFVSEFMEDLTVNNAFFAPQMLINGVSEMAYNFLYVTLEYCSTFGYLSEPENSVQFLNVRDICNHFNENFTESINPRALQNINSNCIYNMNYSSFLSKLLESSEIHHLDSVVYPMENIPEDPEIEHSTFINRLVHIVVQGRKLDNTRLGTPNADINLGYLTKYISFSDDNARLQTILKSPTLLETYFPTR